ncbi:ATP-binding protein [Paenibacillus chartarius]|uniref:histidine kinase n=1 Tax=Paenibacillus chartarius TaxID=747481 RepID=A0ABV6DH03_9BACL
MSRFTRKQSLARLIRSIMNLSTMVTVLLFGMMVLLLMSAVLRPLAQLGAQMVAHSVMREMGSSAFPKEHGIGSLRELDESAPGWARWKRAMERQEMVDYRLPFIDKNENLPYDEGREMPRHIHAVDIAVSIEGRELFRSARLGAPGSGEAMNESSWLLRYFSKPYTAPLSEQDGREIGTITARIEPPLLIVIVSITAALIVLLAAAAILINRLLSPMLAKPVLRPLRQLQDTFKDLADGKADQVWEGGVQFKETYTEVSAIASEADRIVKLLGSHLELQQQQVEELEAQSEELEAQRDELESLNTELTGTNERLERSKQQIAQQAMALKQLLDHAGQGFMGIMPDFRITDTYSKECEELFGGNLAGRSFPELISLGNKEQEAFLQSLITNIFQEKNPGRREIYVTLLTSEIVLAGKVIRLDYKMITADQLPSLLLGIMVIATDMTETRKLEAEKEEERKRLEMIVKVVTQYKDFTECLTEYRHFSKDGYMDILDSGKPSVALTADLYRELHTFKGSFALFGLSHTVQRLHEAETELSGWMADGSLTAGRLMNLLQEWNMPGWTDEDLAILGSLLGAGINQERDVLLVEKERLLAIEHKMASLLSAPEFRLLQPELRKLRQVTFAQMLEAYPAYTLQLAEKSGKAMHPFRIEGGAFYVDSEVYHSFVRTLIHLFRNIVDHGLETPEVRQARGKPVEGSIHCKARLEHDAIVLEIGDDGNGIQVDAVAAKAVANGIVTEEEAGRMTEEQAMDLIFHAELSTRNEVSELSGRGVGLSAVRTEAEKLGGTVRVDSRPEKGTVFVLRVPMREALVWDEPLVPDMIEPLIAKTEAYIAETLGEALPMHASFQLVPSRRLELNQVSVFIGLRGVLDGLFVLTADEHTARRLFKQLALEVDEADISGTDLEDAIAEAGNVILGNCLEKLSAGGRTLTMEPPITVSTEKASFTYVESDIWACEPLSGFDSQLSIRIVLRNGTYQQHLIS